MGNVWRALHVLHAQILHEQTRQLPKWYSSARVLGRAEVAVPPADWEVLESRGAH